MSQEQDSCSKWQLMLDSLLLRIFSNLEVLDLLHSAAPVCKAWNRVANDEVLWKNLFYKDWKIKKSVPPAPKMESWKKEYKRLKYHTPFVETEVLTDHMDEVFYVSFSHNGKMFASGSKDAVIKVWNANYPATVRYSANMKEFGWENAIFTKFNKSDTLLLVAGKLLCDGEIIVFTVHDKFTVQSRVLTHPADTYGAWYNDTHFLSAYLTHLHRTESSLLIWINRVCIETNTSGSAKASDTDSKDAKLFRFYNRSLNSSRSIMVVDCLSADTYIGDNISELKTEKSWSYEKSWERKRYFSS